MMVNRSKHK